jgi:hypothetical protein
VALTQRLAQPSQCWISQVYFVGDNGEALTTHVMVIQPEQRCGDPAFPEQVRRVEEQNANELTQENWTDIEAAGASILTC